jgi:Tn3 transposase DDE domain
MPRMNILDAVEREAFDSPPVFNSFQRKQYFDFPSTPIRRWPPQSGLAEACKLLIKNCIICWNYLYLSQKLEEIKETASREAFLDAVAHGSAVAWQHLNLLGEYARTTSCETASKFDPQNWWTKWGAILGGSPKSENPIYQRG